MAALDLIRMRVQVCEAEGVAILCCPEAILGGLADYSGDPGQFAIAAVSGRLDAVLAPLASNTVTTIIGFTELAEAGQLHNGAAVFQRGSVVGVYRKLYPAINQSVYEAGKMPSSSWPPDVRHCDLQRFQRFRAHEAHGRSRSNRPLHSHKQRTPSDKGSQRSGRARTERGHRTGCREQHVGDPR